MFDMITIALLAIALSALGVAGYAITSLSNVKRRLSGLGIRVLEGEDIGKIKVAADKVDSYEKRMSGCEHKADENKNQLAGHEAKLSGLTEKLDAAEQKMASFDVRSDELSGRLGSVEEKVKQNEDGLAEAVRNIDSLEEEIRGVQKFQTATEKIHSLIQSAFDDMQVSAPVEHAPAVMPEDDKLQPDTPEEASQDSEQWQEQAQEQEVSKPHRWQF